MLFSVFTRKGKMPRHNLYSPRSQLSSVAQSCPTLCNPMDYSTPGLAVHHQLPEPTQTHVHWVGDATQPSHPLSFPLLLPSVFPSIRVFSNESVFHIRWPKDWSFSFNVSPSNEYGNSPKRRQNSVGSSFRARFPHLVQLSSLREPGTQPKWPSVSSGHPNGGDQVSLTAAQTNDHC